MFTWPSLELTPYELKFVRAYKDGNYPGVLRRTYEVFLNSVADPLTPGLETIKLKGQVQIARRARVFGLSFAGALGSWRLQIELASGEQMTPKANQADGYPIVSSLIAGGSWNALSALGDQPTVTFISNGDGIEGRAMFGNETQGPMIIDPSWELTPNETLIFNGTPIDNQQTDESTFTPPAQKLLSIAVHVWEFEGMDGRGARMGGGPVLQPKGGK